MGKKKLKKISQTTLPPEPGSPEFKKLQTEWYRKLKQTGFQDLEAANAPDGKLSNRGKPQPRNYLHYQNTITFYSYIDAYLARPHTVKGSDRYLLRLKQRGHSYREIARLYKKRYGQNMDVKTVFYKIKKLLQDCLEWNKTSKLGCLYTQGDA